MKNAIFFILSVISLSSVPLVIGMDVAEPTEINELKRQISSLENEIAVLKEERDAIVDEINKFNERMSKGEVSFSASQNERKALEARGVDVYSKLNTLQDKLGKLELELIFLS